MPYFIVFSVIILLLLLPLNIKITFDNKQLLVEWMLFGKGVKLYSQTNGKLIKNIFKSKKRKTPKVLPILKQHSKIKYLAVDAQLGASNAASTALLCGKATGLIMPLAANLSKGRYKINIVPEFNEEKFIFSLNCIFSTNLANTLIALLKIRRNKNGKASNRKHYGVNHGKS